MKIILCKGQFLGPISGADETLVTYATQLQRAGHSVSVLLMYPHALDDPHFIRLRDGAVPISTVASSSVRSSLGAGRKLARRVLSAFPSTQQLVRRSGQAIATSVASRYYEQCLSYLKASQAAIVHVITPDPSAAVIIRASHAAGIPVIYQELGTPYHPPDYESYYEQFTLVLPLCSEVTALSPSLARQCRETLPQSKFLSVLPIMAEDLRNGHRAPLHPPGVVTIGFAARIEHLKGPMVLLEAFAAASHRNAGLRLKIAGTGVLEQKLAARADALGVASKCEFVGVYSMPVERKKFMQQLDIFVLPSLTEGTPNSIAEAMSHSLPVIASAVGGIPDVVTSDTGLLVPPNDPAALTEAILQLAKDPKLRARMGEAAALRYENLFSPKVVLPVLLNTYQRVIDRAPSNALQSNEDACLHPWAQVVFCD